MKIDPPPGMTPAARLVFDALVAAVLDTSVILALDEEGTTSASVMGPIVDVLRELRSDIMVDGVLVRSGTPSLQESRPDMPKSAFSSSFYLRADDWFISHSFGPPLVFGDEYDWCFVALAGETAVFDYERTRSPRAGEAEDWHHDVVAINIVQPHRRIFHPLVSAVLPSVIARNTRDDMDRGTVALEPKPKAAPRL